ncbi:KAP family P-loop NTPase fold protein [Chryseobacterium viscerum]|uniref:KAP NTPase domain-containing protein n=1 Tax=Chryseobacterium viscerum TaxID=1037377 RepID=A0A316WDE5_9FLAO|nr:P-loop NTPase fold protein [Chryseobacterium viscerum]PWN58056.1 hypothetical protein C1634_024825 [Chryseobacterium viscerum]
MKKEEKSIFTIITDYLYQFKVLFIILLIVSFFPNLVKKIYESYYEKYIIKILLHFDKSFLSDVILIVIITYIAYWTYIKLKIKFYLKNTYVIYSILIIVLYLIMRICYKDQLLETFFLKDIKYCDFFVIVGFIPIILKLGIYLKNKKSNIKDKDRFFLSDEPIEELTEDILNRKSMSAQVVRLIQKRDPDTSLSIGIVGGWGYGKTSFMSFVKSSFKDDSKYIVVNFNSWLNVSINSIIIDFFDTIEKSISKHSIDVSKEFKKYGNQVLSINKTHITESILNLINLIPDDNLSDSFKKLNTLLNEIDKKIIVFFDDLDRLQPNEVFEVLKLIRNTASFDIFNYVVGYDKEFLIKSLEYNNIPYPEKYCEKIFIKEFYLLPITQSIINEYIKNKLSDFLPEKKHEIEGIFNNVNVLTILDEEINIFKSINNIRDAKRFIYEFIIGVEQVIYDVKFEDFLFIKLLKFSYYDVYSLLFNKQKYLENNENAFSGEMQYIHYRLKIDKESKRNSLRDTFENSYLYFDLISLNIYNESQLKNIVSICNQIFKLHNNLNVSSLSIIYGDNYFKYFEDEISEINYKASDFENFIKSNFIEQKKIIDNLEIEDKLNSLILFLYKINVYNDIISKSQYENFVRILFYIGSLNSDKTDTQYRGIDFDILRNSINNYENLIVERFGYNNISELNQFIKSILYQEKESYYFEIDFIKYLYTESTQYNTRYNNILLNKEEVIQYLFFCFDKEVPKIFGIDNRFFNCYNLCLLPEYIENESGRLIKSLTVLERNKEKMLYDIIPKYLDEFLLKCVILEEDEHYVGEYTGKVGLPNKDPLKLFQTYSNFIQYLESDKLIQSINNESEFITEFIVFAKEVDSKKKFIDFNFTYAPAVEKILKALRDEE